MKPPSFIKRIKKLPIFFISLALCFGNFVFAATNQQELKSEADKKNQELKEINAQVKKVQNSLEDTKSQKQTLQSELNQMNSNLNQLDLGIKSSQITIEKLGLEIESDQYDIEDSTKKIQMKKETIAEILRQLQQKDEFESPALIFLKNKRLTDVILEIQGMKDLQDKMVVDINEFKDLKDQLSNQVKTATIKKQQKSIEAENFKNRKIIIEETKKYRQTLLTQTKEKEKAYQQSLTELQKRQEQIAYEIEKLEAELRGQINTKLLPPSGTGVLLMPVQGIITQDYGSTNFAKKGGYRGKWHNGVDIAAPIGTPVFAAEKGEIIASGNQDSYCHKGAYGKFVVIKHENNLATLYAHLSLIIKKEGDLVERGDLIGYVGNTGYSTGSHLHFTVYAANTVKIEPSKQCGPKMPYGGDLNPMKYL